MKKQGKTFLFRFLVSLCLFFISGCSQAEVATATATLNPPTFTLTPVETSTPEPSPTPLPVPVAQGYIQMVYDVIRDKIILVPNLGDNYKSLESQTWIFDLASNTWEKGDGPPWGEGPMAYDSQSDRAILFQGTEGSVLSFQAAGKTWAYNADDKIWVEKHPSESPFGIIGARMVYDSESDRIILFGGLNASDLETESTDTWAYDYDTNTWTNMQPKGTIPFPEGENYFAMSYDARADRVIVWRCTESLSENKIGVYSYNSNTWEERETETHPDYCAYNSMVYDPITGLNILFGGVRLVNGSLEPSNETWGYDYETNTWQLLSASNPPSARGWHGMVYDSAANVILLFGGGPRHRTFTNEIWIYDSINNEWSNVMP